MFRVIIEADEESISPAHCAFCSNTKMEFGTLMFYRTCGVAAKMLINLSVPFAEWISINLIDTNGSDSARM
jgi:hypothetical protein